LFECFETGLHWWGDKNFWNNLAITSDALPARKNKQEKHFRAGFSEVFLAESRKDALDLLSASATICFNVQKSFYMSSLGMNGCHLTRINRNKNCLADSFHRQRQPKILVFSDNPAGNPFEWTMDHLVPLAFGYGIIRIDLNGSAPITG
jgi:hypothetical protein